MRPFKKRQRLTHQQLNALRDGTRRNQIMDMGVGLVDRATPAGHIIGKARTPLESRLCVVTSVGPEDEADYSDARYWVRDMACTNSEEDDDARSLLLVEEAAILNTDGDAIEDTTSNRQVLWGFWETATNLSELVNGSHTLTAGMPVEVFPIYDSRETKNVHWVFFGATAVLSGLRIGKITSRTVNTGVGTDKHTYEGVYDGDGGAVWMTPSRATDGTISWATATLSDDSARDQNITFTALVVDDIVMVVHEWTELADTDAGEESLKAWNPIGIRREGVEFAVET